MDKDKSQNIDFSELKPLLETTLHTKMEKALFNRYVAAVLNLNDKDQNQKVCFNEFLSLYYNIKYSKEV